MVVKYSKFESDTGFASNGNIEITPDGRIVALSVDVTEIKLNGTVLFTASGSGSGALNLDNGIAVQGSTTISSGLVTISSTPVGTIDNIDIGSIVAANGKFTQLTATDDVVFSHANQNITLAPLGAGTLTIDPESQGTIDNVSVGATLAAPGRFTTLTLTQEATTNSQVPSKGYVDSRISALAIALGS